MTDEQRAVLSHVVLDPDAWYAGAVAGLGQDKADVALVAKVARWKPSYDAAVAAGNYQTRAQREAA